MNRWLFRWRKLTSELWFRATVYALFGVAVSLLAGVGAPFVPQEIAEPLGGESVEQILTILASSLLAVATFSVGAMVTAYTAVSQSATPRVAALVTSDGQTQRSLATFVGAFLYAIVSVTAINAGYYDQGGRAILFLASLGVVGLVAYRLLAWINRLSSLARVGHMIELVEDHTAEAMLDRRRAPHLGGGPGHVRNGEEISSCRTGYVQNVDPDRLQKVAARHDCRVEILTAPGVFVRRGDAVARISRDGLGEEARDDFLSAFTVRTSRSFEQDPRFGLAVLGEIGAKALSPGVNDPGTAIAVIAAAVRLLDDWARPPEEAELEPVCDRVFASEVLPQDLLDDVLGPIARYGAGDLPVSISIQEACAMLAEIEAFARPAARLAADAMARSRLALPIQSDVDRLERAAFSPRKGARRA